MVMLHVSLNFGDDALSRVKESIARCVMRRGPLDPFRALCIFLSHMCQTQARGTNLAGNVFIINPRDHIACALGLARGLCFIFYFKFSFSCVCNIKICLFQILCFSEIKVCFHIKG